MLICRLTNADQFTDVRARAAVRNDFAERER